MAALRGATDGGARAALGYVAVMMVESASRGDRIKCFLVDRLLQAINLALHGLVCVLFVRSPKSYNGFGTIIGGPVPPSDPWYEDLTDVAPYDPVAARAALEDAGYGDGLELTLTWPNLYATSNADFVASQLAEVGIDVTIETIDFSVWLEQVYGNHDYDMTAVLHVEPRDIVNYANPDYYWQYDSPEVQELIAAAKVNPDPDQSVEQLKEAARLISEDSPVDWLILAADLTVSTTDVTGYPTNDTGSRFDASGITVTS